MKNILLFGFLMLGNIALAQYTTERCVNFEDNTTLLIIDSTSIWISGLPSTTLFDTSYNSSNSIFTSIDSNLAITDTSFFNIEYYREEGGIHLPNYLGIFYPFELDFYHRYSSDSLYGIGKIEFSIDNGDTWHDAFSNQFNATNYQGIQYLTYHISLTNNDTLNNPLLITGNSNGWIHSHIVIDIGSLINSNQSYPKILNIRFTLISDSLQINQGWQIDEVCMKMDVLTDIKEQININNFISFYPNPTNTKLQIDLTNNEPTEIKLYNILGEKVLTETVKESKAIDVSVLTNGLYLIKACDVKVNCGSSKLLIN